MAQGIDALQIEISAKATSANNAINRLTKNLDKLSTSLNSLNVSNVGGLSNVATQTNAVASGSTKMDNALKKTNTTMRTTSKSAWSLAKAFGKFYANYFLIIRGAKALWGSIESTADYIEAYNYYNVAFGKIASEWKGYFNEELGKKLGISTAEEYAESFTGRMNETLGKLSGVQISVGADGKGLLTDTGMKNLGLNIQEITQYASQLASVTNAVGQTGETSLAVARIMTMLAGDVSSLFNVNFSNVATNIQAVLQGQSRAGYKYGWDTTLATLQKYADELNLSKAVSEMTQLEKQQLRIIAVLDQSKVSWGDLANTINSPSNMIRQLTTNLKEAGMVLGQLFIPLLENVLPVINGVTIAFKRLLVSIADAFGITIDLDQFGQGYNEIEDATGDLADGYDDLADSVKEAKNQILGFDEITKLSDSSSILDTDQSSFDLTDEILKATEEYEKAWNEAFKNMENKSNKIADDLEKAFSDFANSKAFKEVKEFWQIGRNAGKNISDAMAEAFGELEDYNTEKLKQIRGHFDDISIQAGKLSDHMQNIYKVMEGKEFGEFVKNITKIADLTIMRNIEGLAGFVSDLFKLFTQPVIDNSNKIVDSLNTILEITNNLLGPFAEFQALYAQTEADYKDSWVHKLMNGMTNMFSKGLSSNLDNFNNNLKILEELTSGNTSVLPFSESIEGLSDNFIVLRKNASTAIRDLKTLFKPLTDWFETNVKEPLDDIFKDISEGMSDALSGVWDSTKITIGGAINQILQNVEDFINLLIGGFNSFIGKANSFLSVLNKIPGLSDYELFKEIDKISIGSISVNPTSKSTGGGGRTRAYAMGGFPDEGQLFIAREAGPELVGTMGGRTAVANNDQITQGIAQAVAPAVYNAVVSAMQATSSNGDIIVNIDGKQVFKVVQRQANNYIAQTGQSPFYV